LETDVSLRGKLDRGGVKGKIALSAVMVLVAAGLIGGTYATWMSTVSQAQAVTSGTVEIALGTAGAATNRLSVATGAIAPGDTIERSVDLINSGSLALSEVTLTTTATTSSVLDTDTTNGLQLTIDSCSVPWTESGAAPTSATPAREAQRSTSWRGP
jgi:spore coat-associated protein N